MVIVVFSRLATFCGTSLPVRVARVGHEMLQNTVSTNGRVEPVVNYPFYSPLATTVKAVYAQEGDVVRAGKLLVTLDDVEARAQVASAESACETAQATLDAAMHNGTQAERQAAAAEIEQDRLARTRRNMISTRSRNWPRPAPPRRARWPRHASTSIRRRQA